MLIHARWHVWQVRTATEATGVANVGGNKGAVGVSFRLGSLSLCFVNMHLAPHQTGLSERNKDLLQIIRRLRLGDLDLTSQFHVLFFLGDLNYRLTLSTATALRLIGQESWERLRQHDELSGLRLSKTLLYGFAEGGLYFEPTYKYLTGVVQGHRYDSSTRTPAWCDRVLWKLRPGVSLQQTYYSHVAELSTSDHKPVKSCFRLGYPNLLRIPAPLRARDFTVTAAPATSGIRPVIIPPALPAVPRTLQPVASRAAQPALPSAWSESTPLTMMGSQHTAPTRTGDQEHIPNTLDGPDDGDEEADEGWALLAAPSQGAQRAQDQHQSQSASALSVDVTASTQRPPAPSEAHAQSDMFPSVAQLSTRSSLARGSSAQSGAAANEAFAEYDEWSRTSSPAAAATPALFIAAQQSGAVTGGIDGHSPDGAQPAVTPAPGPYRWLVEFTNLAVVVAAAPRGAPLSEPYFTFKVCQARVNGAVAVAALSHCSCVCVLVPVSVSRLSSVNQVRYGLQCPVRCLTRHVVH